VRRWALILIAALDVVLALAGTAGARTQLVIGVSQFPPTLNPLDRKSVV